jgi:hypothetical protein
MEEILNWAGTCLRVVLATMFLVTPGVAVWLVVAGILVAVRRFGRSSLYLTVRNRVRPAASPPS